VAQELLVLRRSPFRGSGEEEGKEAASDVGPQVLKRHYIIKYCVDLYILHYVLQPHKAPEAQLGPWRDQPLTGQRRGHPSRVSTATGEPSSGGESRRLRHDHELVGESLDQLPMHQPGEPLSSRVRTATARDSPSEGNRGRRSSTPKRGPRWTKFTSTSSDPNPPTPPR
jgi:hypothetical protein